ncbi:MAG: hypothetical protein ACTSO9_03595 [Candidatus Helarchaeota archaeon]
MEDFEFKRVKNLANCLAFRKSSKLRIPKWIPPSYINKYENEEQLKKIALKIFTGMIKIRNFFDNEENK